MTEVTGSVLIRDARKTSPDGRKIVMIMGVLAVPEEFEFEEENIYLVLGDHGGGLQLMSGTAQPVPEQYANLDADQLYLSPVWRV